MVHATEPTIYQLKVVLLSISPMIWRRLLVCSDSTIADLRHILQTAMGWEDCSGPWAFIALRQQYPLVHVVQRLVERGGKDL
jgi:hypothetical protein